MEEDFIKKLNGMLKAFVITGISLGVFWIIADKAQLVDFRGIEDDYSSKHCESLKNSDIVLPYKYYNLLSAKEVYGLDDNLFYDISWYATEQLDYYDINFVTYTTAGQQGTKTNYDKAIKKLNGTAKAWWFRSPVMHSKESFAYVGTSGEWKTTAANGNYGIAPAFRIAKNS